ncbi:MAG: tryptophan synthase subunit alpha [Planctomycetota bacterium]
MNNDNRIDSKLADLSSNGKKGLLPYVTAGLPDLITTKHILHTLDDLGVTAVELGFPYSDPIADGATIQTSFTRVLDSGIRVRDILEMVTRFRAESEMPLLAMLSYSIVYRIGVQRFIDMAGQAGIDGMILPDLSLEEAPQTAKLISDAGLRLPMLVSPVTTSERRQKIANISTGFIYYMSVTGITGERDQLPPELTANVHQLRASSGRPVVVGFGISTADHVRLVCTEADGAIIGSALVRRIMEAQDAGKDPDEIIKVVKSAVSDWMTGLP